MDTNPESARRTARGFFRSYLSLANYTRNMQRGGFTAQDVAGEGSDDLIDRTVAHGDAPAPWPGPSRCISTPAPTMSACKSSPRPATSSPYFEQSRPN